MLVPKKMLRVKDPFLVSAGLQLPLSGCISHEIINNQRVISCNVLLCLELAFPIIDLIKLSHNATPPLDRVYVYRASFCIRVRVRTYARISHIALRDRALRSQCYVTRALYVIIRDTRSQHAAQRGRCYCAMLRKPELLILRPSS